MNKVRVLGIVGSPRKGGNTELLVREALEGARSVAGVETRILLLAEMNIGPCSGCYSCSSAYDLCALQFRDDMHSYYEAFLWADGLIIEVHGNPEQALSDGAQSLKPHRFAELVPQLRLIAEAVGRTL